MGPQLDSCGRDFVGAPRERRCVLQWGRNLIVAEGDRPHPHAPVRAPLQWGRNLIVAEGPAPPRRWPRRTGFNGAAT